MLNRATKYKKIELVAILAFFSDKHFDFSDKTFVKPALKKNISYPRKAVKTLSGYAFKFKIIK